MTVGSIQEFILVACLLAVIVCLVARGRSLGRTVSELRGRVAQLEPLVFVDVLTGIGNRRKFDDALITRVAHAMRAEESLVVLYMDVNGFKEVNDRYGHPFGDKLLHRVAESLVDAVRPTDTVCRLGGDEFAVILTHCNLVGAHAAAARIVKTLAANALSRDDDLVHLLVSIGGTCMETGGMQITVGGKFVGATNERDLVGKIPALLCQGADNRLYVAKQRKFAEDYPVEIS